MKKILIALFITSGFAATAQVSDADAIRQVITTSYIGGIQNGGSIDDIRKGFHPTFTMLRLMDNDIKPLPIEEWITNLEKSRKENKPAPPPAEGKFISVDVTGTAAMVKLELYRGGKQTFTDYLVLTKFAEGWKIVSKSFYRHP